MASLALAGDRQSGQDVRTQNGACSGVHRAPLSRNERTPMRIRSSSFGGAAFRRLMFPAFRCLPPPLPPSVTAVQAVANIIRTSLGPVGLDKVRGGHWI